jgi:hypothetical protein
MIVENINSVDNIDQVDQVDCIKYNILIDINNNKTRWTVYHLEHYKIEILVKYHTDNTIYNIMNNTLYDKDSIKIRKISELKPDIHNNIYKKIKVDKQFAEDCISMYESENKLKKLKNRIFFSTQKMLLTIDVSTEYFNNGMKCFKLHNYNYGIEQFTKCIESLNNNIDDSKYNLSYYTIACCHVHNNNIDLAFDGLNNAIKYGYTNWGHAITDNDMALLIDIPYFVKLIKTMMEIQPKRSINNENIPKKYNAIDIFLISNRLEHLENQNNV